MAEVVTRYPGTRCLIQVAIVALAAGAVSPALAGETEREKCYEVARAGGNDCATATSVCAGHSVEDGQEDAWLWLPKGTCERLVGGRPG